MEQFVEQLKAMGDITRLKIIRLVMEVRQDLCVCEIMDALEVSHCNISRHLKILKTAGFVKEKKEGRWVHFSLVDPESPFHRSLLQAVRDMPAENFADEIERLKLRLSLREDGKCIAGLKSAKWMAVLKLIRAENINRHDKSRMQDRR